MSRAKYDSSRLPQIYYIEYNIEYVGLQIVFKCLT